MHIHFRISFTSPWESHNICFHHHGVQRHRLKSLQDSCGVSVVPIVLIPCSSLVHLCFMNYYVGSQLFFPVKLAGVFFVQTLTDERGRQQLP